MVPALRPGVLGCACAVLIGVGGAAPVAVASSPGTQPWTAGPPPSSSARSRGTDLRPVRAVVDGLRGGAGLRAAAERDRVVRDRDLREVSGVVAATRHRDLLWVHEDSGNPPVVYGLDAGGRTVARVRLSGGTDVDWEAIAATRDAAGRSLLVVGDIGDNDAERGSVTLLVVAEPARLGDVTVRPLALLRLHYPDGAADAETLIADPRDGRLYVVTKGLFGGRVFAVPEAVWAGSAERLPEGATLQREGTLLPLAALDVPLITDGAALPDGRLVTRSYTTLSVWRAPEDLGNDTARPLVSMRLPAQPQGEGLAVVDGGRDVLLTSEGSGQPVLRLALPAAAQATGRPSRSAGSSGTPSPPVVSARASGRAGSGGEAGRGARRDAGRSWVADGRLLVVLGAGAVAALLAWAALRAPRGRAPRPPRRPRRGPS